MRRLGLIRFSLLMSMPTAMASAMVATGALVVSGEREARACGGCFVPPVQVDRTVVTDHRMAFAISRNRTVLWDQIRYSGDPREFAWVLPVKSGATVELSNDAWFSALDASTQPVVVSPTYYGGGYGCALTGCGSSAGSSGFSADAPGPGQVQIVSQKVVGPYETVTLRATDPNALENWLTEHAFAIPPAIKPTIDKYVAEQFDFIALRLVPTCNERSMQPVRIVTPGADASLPLRMVAAGIGAKVGITLYVISEGRYHPQNFPDAVFDESSLAWDRASSRSNYEELSQAAMAAHGGHAWLTEYANHPNLYDPGVGYGYPGSTGYYSNTNNPGLAEAYFAQCRPSYSGGGTPVSQDSGVLPQPCTEQIPPSTGGADAGADADADATDGATTTSDASDDAARDASDDARASDAGSTPAPTWDGGYAPGIGCAGFDDLDVAVGALHHDDIWVTRLRAILPSDALKVGDLRLEPVTGKDPIVSNFHQTTRYADESGKARSGCASSARARQPPSGYAALGIFTMAIAAMIRRRLGRRG
jgi:hypothetical protein